MNVDVVLHFGNQKRKGDRLPRCMVDASLIYLLICSFQFIFKFVFRFVFRWLYIKTSPKSPASGRSFSWPRLCWWYCT